jgi:hypothetical protein
VAFAAVGGRVPVSAAGKALDMAFSNRGVWSLGVGLGVCVGLVGAAWAQAPFTIAVLPDTQFYSESTLGPGVNFFDRQTGWIVSQASNPALNIRYVTHLGDVVDDAGPVGTPFLDQWDDAVRAMGILRVSGVAHGILPGNHDWTVANGTGSLEHYRARFGDTSGFFSGQPWFLGFDARGVNSASRVSTPIGDMLFISLEWNAAGPAVDSSRPGATASPLAWAQGIIDANPNVPTVISTHNNVNTAGVRDGQGLALYNTLVRPNNQVFLVLNGHYSSSSVTERLITSTNNFGRPVYEMLTDYQALARGGDGWLRLLTLDAANGRIQVRTFTPLSDATLGVPAPVEFGGSGRVQTDADSQYELPLNFATRFVPPPPPPPAPPAPVAAGAYTLKQGLNGYVGTDDTEVRTSNAGASFGSQGYMHVDTDDTAGGGPAGPSHGLVRFNGLFGSGPNQFPADRDVMSATLRLYTHPGRAFADGSGFEVRRMLVDWSESSTWNSLSVNGAGITANGSNGFEALANADGFVGANTSGVNVGFGTWMEFPVTRSVRAWKNGQANYGWLLQAFPGASNAIRPETSESELPGGFFPELVIVPTRDAVVTASFTQGVDTYVDQSVPTASFGVASQLIVDASVENNNNAALSDSQGLVRFTGVFGNGAASVPAGVRVSSAVLKLNINGNVQFHDGGGFGVHRMLTGWSASDTWNSLGAGVSADDVEAALRPDDVGGLDVLNTAVVQRGVYYLDVTDSVRRWSAAGGEGANFGWALLPLPNATNAIFFDSFNSTAAAAITPELVVRYVPGCTRSDVAGPGLSDGADGELTADDIIVFINWFSAGDARADFSGPAQVPVPDGEFTADDILVFISRFSAGCL